MFYELAIRHAVNKPVILIATEGTIIPFDVRNERVVFYSLDPDDLISAKGKLIELIKTVDSPDYENESPLKSKINIESTKTVGEKELLLKIYNKILEIGTTPVNVPLEIEPSVKVRLPRLSMLTKRILNIIDDSGPISNQELITFFPDSKQATILDTLTRLQSVNFVAYTSKGFVITNLGRNSLVHYQ